jgi:hypothetical protein
MRLPRKLARPILVNGYAWYGTSPQQAFEAYAEWSKTHPQPTHNSGI